MPRPPLTGNFVSYYEALSAPLKKAKKEEVVAEPIPAPKVVETPKPQEQPKVEPKPVTLSFCSLSRQKMILIFLGKKPMLYKLHYLVTSSRKEKLKLNEELPKP